MHNEILTIFDEAGHRIGTAPRAEVHRLGHWHETFHCWFINKTQEIPYIYLQLRSEQKQDYAGLLDITAAGHLLTHETVEDGIREVQEELGLELAFDELIPLGTIPYCMIKENLIDKERAHVFVYNNPYPLDDFKLQEEEVAGIVITKFVDFRSFWQGEIHSLQINGFKVDSNGQKINIQQSVDRTHFVPHEAAYFTRIIEGIEAIILTSTIVTEDI
ncbi:NUDIX domain-containing protein [Paenibacillus sp. FSL R10-2791]|uniref:NUDIX hydrolase n=1 Tax=unclassified Paenibacillus TaxID=185978 RepID=UPI0030F6F01C